MTDSTPPDPTRKVEIPAVESTTAWYATPTEAAEFARTTGFALLPTYMAWTGGAWSKRPRPGCMWKEESTSDPGEVVLLWEKYGQYDPEQRSMVSIHCGKSGIFVIDEDDPGKVTGDFERLMAESESLTLVRRSVSRGTRHVYFRQPELTDGMVVLDSCFEGGEIKGDGYVAVSSAPPIAGVIPMPAPAWVIELCTVGRTMIRTPSGTFRPRLSPELIDSWIATNSVDPVVSDPNSFMRRPIERYWKGIDRAHRRQVCRDTAMSMFIEAMAGCYKLEDAYESLLDAYRASREGTSKPWSTGREADYRLMWVGLMNAFDEDRPVSSSSSGPVDLGEAVHEKRLELGTSAGLDEWMTDEALEDILGEWTALARDHADVPSPSAERIQAMLTAPDVPEESPVALSDEPSDEMDTCASETDEALERDVETRLTAIQALKMYCDDDGGLTKGLHDWANKIMLLLPTLSEAAQEQHVLAFMHASVNVKRQMADLVERRIAENLSRDLMRDSDQAGKRVVIEPALIELDWQPIEPPGAMLRTDLVGLVYLGGVSHELVGDAACGKTTMALLMAVQLCRAGETVVWVDFEMGRKRITNWLMRLGMRQEEVSRFVLLDFVRDEANLADALEWMRGPGNDVALSASVVVIDSMARAINRLDNVPEGVENSSQAIVQLTDSFISRVCDMGVSTVVIDHTGHMEKHRARGSSAKRQQTDVSYSVETLLGWSSSSEGANLVTSRKDRDGYFVADEPVCVGVFTPDLAEPDERRRRVSVELVPPEEMKAMAWMVAKEEAKDTVREKVKVARREERKGTLVETVRDVIGSLAAGERRSQNQVIEMVKEVVGPCARADVIAAMNACLARDEVSMERIGQSYLWSRK